MVPGRRVRSRTTKSAQAPDDNVEKPRVTTRSSKKRNRTAAGHDEAEIYQVNKVKAGRPKWSRVIGRLSGLMEMPMDILFEILGHLMPLDVLRIARTTKQFRRMLMHRSSISIWITARKNVPDLPHCPPYLNEPQFANLVFDTHCHECLSPNIRSIEWRIGRRICAKCVKECMVEDYSPFVGESVYKCVPSKYGKRGRPSYYSKDLEEFQSKRASLTDPEERDKFVKERQALVIQTEKHGALLEAWAASQAKNRSEQLDDLRRERKDAIVQNLTKLGWGPEVQQILPRDDLSFHRLVKQPIRLTPRIWANIQDEMVSYMEQMKTQRLERERKALVISRKRIAVSILRAYKISHLPLTDVMPEPMDFCAIPEVLEILERPSETQVNEDTFAPIVEKMDELFSDWRTRILGFLVQKVMDTLYPHRDRQGETTDSMLVDNPRGSSSVGKGKAKAAEPSIPDDSKIIQGLSLATTVFNCKSCNPRFDDDFIDSWGFGLGPHHSRSRSNPLFFPKVLGHHCLTKQLGLNWDSSSGDPTKQYDYPSGNRTRWNGHLLQLDEKAGKMVANLVTTCGLDPETTTATEMDQMNHQLACLECLEWSDVQLDEAEALVFSWRGAVSHNCRAHPGKINTKWKLIEEELAQGIVKLDEEYPVLSALDLQGLVDDAFDPPEEAAWLCAHCLDHPNEAQCRGLSQVKQHLASHTLSGEPQENQDYYKDYEAPQGRPTRTPCLKICLAMERPDDVPGLGERFLIEPMIEPWFGYSDDEFYDDDFL